MYLKNFSVYLPEADRYLLQNLSFSLMPQDKLALIGEEGNGKSTLLRLLQGQDLGSYVQVTGELNREGAYLAYLPQSLGAEDLAKSPSAYLWQHLAHSELDYGLYYRLLDRLQLEEDRLQEGISLGQLSGGERIKFLLLLVQLQTPDIYLLDEPSNDLDFEGLEVLENFILESEKPVLFVSHDEVLLENCANAILHVEHLGPDLVPHQSFVRLPYREYREKHLQQSQRQMQVAKKDRSQFTAKLERHQQIFERVQHELRTVSRQDPATAKNLKDKMRSVKAQEKRYEKEGDQLRKKPLRERPIRLDFAEDLDLPHSSKEILNLHVPELRVGSVPAPGHTQGRLLSSDIKLQIRGVEKICLVGPNGCGKTTLLKIIEQELRQSELNIAYMPQNYFEAMDPAQTPIEFLSRSAEKSEHTAVRTFLGSLEFRPDEMFLPLGQLSGGQLAKLYMAKMVFSEASYLILDEPTRNLSPLSAPKVRAALAAYPGGIIAVSHDRKFIREVVDKVYRLDPSGLQLLSPAEQAEI